MEISWQLVILFIIGLVCSWIGGFISGGVSLFGVGGMLMMGIPPQVTMPTYFAGSLLARIGHLHVYRKAKKVVWRLVAPLCVATFLGSMIGAYVLLSVDTQTVSRVINLAFLLFIPLAFLKTDLGVVAKPVSRRRELAGFFVYFLIAAWTAFFAAWAGMLMLFAYLYFFKLTILQIKGTDSLPGTFLDIGALVVFLSSGSIHWDYAAAFCPDMIIGTILGAKTALRLGDGRLQLLVRMSVLFVSIKVLVQIKILRPLLSLFGAAH